MHIRYAVASECPRWKVWEFTYDGLWENVRYELELELLKTTRRRMWSYFSAMHYTDWERKFDPSLRLRGSTRLNGGESIVLFRKPFPYALAKTQPAGNVSTHGVFVPTHFRFEGLTEQERIAEIMSQNNIFVKKNELQHPNEYTYDGITPIPPDGYVCGGCEETGKHFRADCEKAEDEGSFRAADKVRRPHGIPKSQLRRVEKGERGNAMMDSEGNYVVRQAPSVNKVCFATRAAVPKKQVTASAPVCVDWMLADHFCVSNTKTRYRRTHVADDSVPPPPFDFEEPLRRMDTQTQHKEDEFYARHPSKRHKRNSTCTHWLRGMCVKGPLECEFVHNAGPEYMPVCKFFYNGECSNEDVCTFRHVAKVVPRPPCPDFVRGFCPKGGGCELGHIKRTAPCLSDWDKCGLREEFKLANLQTEMIHQLRGGFRV